MFFELGFFLFLGLYVESGEKKLVVTINEPSRNNQN